MLTLEKIYIQGRLRRTHTQSLAPLRASTRPFMTVSASVWVHLEKLFARLLLITACYFVIALQIELWCMESARRRLTGSNISAGASRPRCPVDAHWVTNANDISIKAGGFFRTFSLKSLSVVSLVVVGKEIAATGNLKTKTDNVFISCSPANRELMAAVGALFNICFHFSFELSLLVENRVYQSASGH